MALTNKEDRLKVRKQYTAEDDIMCPYCKKVSVKSDETIWARGTKTALVIIKCKHCQNKFQVDLIQEDGRRIIKVKVNVLPSKPAVNEENKWTHIYVVPSKQEENKWVQVNVIPSRQ